MSDSRTLADFLNAAGVKIAAAPTTPAKPAKTAAAVKKADETAKTKVESGDGASQPATEPAGGKTPRTTAEQAETQDTGKTAAQQWLAHHGVLVQDAKVAEVLFAQQCKIAEQEKFAELEKTAEELRAQGALVFHGFMKEAAAMSLVTGEGDVKTAGVTASLLQVPVESIIKRAEEIAAAVGHPALVGTDLGRAARVDDSRTMQAAAQNGATTEFKVEGQEGTRQPVSGQDAKTERFVDVWTLPGNPGLSHGQAVDQGRAR